MDPNFMIVRCANCTDHQLTLRHDEQIYAQHAYQLQEQLLTISKNVTINQFDIRLMSRCQIGGIDYLPNWEMQRLAKSLKPSHTNKNFWNFRTIPVGAFEVYFMGVKLHSKLITMKWPNISMLTEKCKIVYQNFVDGIDIECHQ